MTQHSILRTQLTQLQSLSEDHYIAFEAVVNAIQNGSPLSMPDDISPAVWDEVVGLCEGEQQL